MEKKFRFYDYFNGCYAYSDNYNNLAIFFEWYQRTVDGGNHTILEQWTGLHDSTTWEELPKEKQKEWLSKDFAPSGWIGIGIYENDIIESFGSDEKPIRHRISYDDHDACFTSNHIPESEWSSRSGIRQSWINEFGKKVIGNSNQHQELLNK